LGKRLIFNELAAFSSEKVAFFHAYFVNYRRVWSDFCSQNMTKLENRAHFRIHFLTAYGCYDFLATPCQPGLPDEYGGDQRPRARSSKPLGAR
jgi:hypothetical protein